MNKVVSPQEITSNQNNPNRLDNLYTYLITNRKYVRQDWHDSYLRFTEDIIKIRKNLKKGLSIQDSKSYGDTIFEIEEQPYDSFMHRLIYNNDNGIAASGLSLFGYDKFAETEGLFKNDPDFVQAIQKVVLDPSSSNYELLKKVWREQTHKDDSVNMNKVLINRICSACNLNLSSVVDERKFNRVNDYFIEEKLIRPLNTSAVHDWYNKNKHLITELKKNLGHYKEQIPQMDDDVWLSIFIWETFEYISKPFDLNKQVIKYGAPGTGKTYKAKKEAELKFNIWKAEYYPEYQGSFYEHFELVQFHPSFGYEDFMEGLKPHLDEEGNVQLQLQNGIFKNFCKKASKWEVDLYRIYGEGDWNPSGLMVSEFLQEIENNPNADSKLWHFLKNISNGEKKLLVEAIPPFFFVIDEINRAELSRVLGELMYCLEKRGIDGVIKTQYSNLNTSSNGVIDLKGSKESFHFFIPYNVFVIGTMNTIDRSVESFDFALRRRFYWEHYEPDLNIVRHQFRLKNRTNWMSMVNDLENLNKQIEEHELLGKDFRLGHAYLMDLPYLKDTPVSKVKKLVWESKIKPLLDEYFRGTGLSIQSFEKAFSI